MAKKVAAPARNRGLIVVRNVDLSVWKQFQKLADLKDVKLGPFLSEAMREKLERDKE